MVIPKRILIVDDSAPVIFVLQQGLMGLGSEYEIITSADGPDALQKIATLSIDLLITDIRLPGMDGIQLTEALRERNREKPVIWVTAYSDHCLRQKAKELGVYDCLNKPVRMAVIRRTVMDALRDAEQPKS
ncbi:MAG: hypothetical protein A2Y73_08410 [Chloroflexi bacterium RBG_13_56_8]|nr:MAG: hypothetical protein A2Y73_08410 [Chloroflexi bacterium RBG_13_56_8]